MPGRNTSLAVLACTCLVVTVVASADEIENVRDTQRNLNAIQSVYRNGVPHTDKTGRLMMNYDPQKSFFQIGSWGVPLPGKVYGYQYDWNVLKTAGYNTAWTWGGVPKPSLAAGSKYGLQIVVMGEISDPDLAAVKDSPNLLGNVWYDEPIGNLGTPKMDTLFADFTAYRSKVHKTAPHLPIFVNDAPWIMAPATSWWLKWDQAGDVSCQDNYPVMDHTARASSIGADPNGIPQSVSLGVASSQEKKPVWLIVGAFEQPGEYGQAFPFRYPSPEQLRACVYAGVIHGATGIVYFTWDTYVSRDGEVRGMSPNPQVSYAPNPRQAGATHPSPATPTQMVKARALWDMAAQINKELIELTPAILSPTVGPEIAYAVNVEGKSPTATPIRTLLKPSPDGGYILLTVNIDDAVLKTTYAFPKPIESAQVLFENRPAQSLTAGSKSAVLTYEPFDTHIVKIKLKP